MERTHNLQAGHKKSVESQTLQSGKRHPSLMKHKSGLDFPEKDDATVSCPTVIPEGRINSANSTAPMLEQRSVSSIESSDGASAAGNGYQLPPR